MAHIDFSDGFCIGLLGESVNVSGDDAGLEIVVAQLCDVEGGGILRGACNKGVRERN